MCREEFCLRKGHEIVLPSLFTRTDRRTKTFLDYGLLNAYQLNHKMVIVSICMLYILLKSGRAERAVAT